MHKIPSPPQAFFDEAGVNADDRVWDYGRACYALALSRGVPADIVLVPREPTMTMLQRGSAAADGLGSPLTRTECAWNAMLAAAPALLARQEGEEGSLRFIAKRNLRRMIETGSTETKTMLLCLEELS